MPTFYLVSGLVTAVALAWLYYYGERSGRLFFALVLMLIWEAGRFLFWLWLQPESG